MTNQTVRDALKSVHAEFEKLPALQDTVLKKLQPLRIEVAKQVANERLGYAERALIEDRFNETIAVFENSNTRVTQFLIRMRTRVIDAWNPVR